MHHILMVNAVKNQDSGSRLEYRQLIQDKNTFPVWNKESENDFGRLAQGVGGGGGIEVYNPILLIPRQEIP
jgi:hypothetical protein